jgi:hypothetical protein
VHGYANDYVHDYTPRAYANSYTQGNAPGYVYGYAYDYTHGYATWLCPKAMPINNFYGGLYAKKKITLSTVSISFLTLIRLSLPNIFV